MFWLEDVGAKNHEDGHKFFFSPGTFGTYLQLPVVICQPAVIFIFPMALQPLVNQSLLFIEASQSRSNTPQSVGLLWTSDQPDTETCTRQHTTLKRDWHPFPSSGFEPVIPANERQQTHALGCKATAISSVTFIVCVNIYTHFDLRGWTVKFLRFYSPFILATNW